MMDIYCSIAPSYWCQTHHRTSTRGNLEPISYALSSGLHHPFPARHLKTSRNSFLQTYLRLGHPRHGIIGAGAPAVTAAASPDVVIVVVRVIVYSTSVALLSLRRLFWDPPWPAQAGSIGLSSTFALRSGFVQANDPKFLGEDGFRKQIRTFPFSLRERELC